MPIWSRMCNTATFLLNRMGYLQADLQRTHDDFRYENDTSKGGFTHFSEGSPYEKFKGYTDNRFKAEVRDDVGSNKNVGEGFTGRESSVQMMHSSSPDSMLRASPFGEQSHTVSRDWKESLGIKL